MTRLEKAFRNRPNLAPHAQMITDYLKTRMSNQSVIRMSQRN